MSSFNAALQQPSLSVATKANQHFGSQAVTTMQPTQTSSQGKSTASDSFAKNPSGGNPIQFGYAMMPSYYPGDFYGGYGYGGGYGGYGYGYPSYTEPYTPTMTTTTGYDPGWGDRPHSIGDPAPNGPMPGYHNEGSLQVPDDPGYHTVGNTQVPDTIYTSVNDLNQTSQTQA